MPYEKIIVFNHCGTPAFTTEENYNKPVMNMFYVNKCKNFESLDQLAQYIEERLGYKFVEVVK